MLGSAETIGDATDLFAPLPGRSPAFRRRDQDARTELGEFPTAFSARAHRPPALADGRPRPNPVVAVGPQPARPHRGRAPAAPLPAAVLVNDKGDIVYISGRTGKYLEPAAGQGQPGTSSPWPARACATNWPMAFRKALPADDRSPATPCASESTAAKQYVDVTVQPIRTRIAARPGDDRVYRRPPPVPNPNRPHPARRRHTRPAGAAGAGTPAGPRRAAHHPRGDADLAGGTPLRQRGTAIHQRGTAVDQRGTHHLQGGDAVAERGTADAQRRVAGQGGRAVAGQRRHEEPARQHRHRHPVPRRDLSVRRFTPRTTKPSSSSSPATSAGPSPTSSSNWTTRTGR
jgi:hypothetical protein